MAQTNDSHEQVTINVETLQPVTRTLMTIGALPTSYLISMTYEEQLLWLQNYLTKTVIPAINNNAEATEEVQDIVMSLQQYINDYFNNLDVQQEINKKLDEMAQDGSLTTLIENYVNPYINELNSKISVLNNNMNAQFANQNIRINSLASGSPLVANSVAEMTDTSRVYVNTSNGYWYYYNGTEWLQGGVYQATEDSDTVNELSRLQTNIINDIKDYVELNNFIEWKIGDLQNGEITTANDRIVTTNILNFKYPVGLSVVDNQKFRFKVAYYDENDTYLNTTPWQYNSANPLIIPSNTNFRICAVRFSSYEDLRPIGVYNSDVYKSIKVANIYNLSLLVDLKDEIDALSSNKFKILNPILKNYLNFSTGVQIQGLTKVNNELWQFSASAPDHTSYYGQILQIDENKNVTTKFHNFGHIPCVNYIKNKDMLIFGNAGVSDVTPVLGFYRNVTQHVEDIFSVTDENYTEIDLSSLGTYANISLGESDNIVYLFTSNKIIKCLIGYGQNDYSSDLGTYNYIDDNTINGTLKILEEYDLSGKLSDITSTIQCELYLKDGRYAFLVGVNTSHLYIYSFNNKGDFVLDEVLNLRDMNNNGNYQSAEPEGIFQDFENNTCYISYKLSDSLRINEFNF